MPFLTHSFSFPVSLEGALGKITTHSVRNPRQLLQVSDRKASNVSAQESSEQPSPEDQSEVRFLALSSNTLHPPLNANPTVP
jgi:DNA topoisomerase 2-associated protein PAT1